jgi:hypothetical protein
MYHKLIESSRQPTAKYFGQHVIAIIVSLRGIFSTYLSFLLPESIFVFININNAVNNVKGIILLYRMIINMKQVLLNFMKQFYQLAKSLKHKNFQFKNSYFHKFAYFRLTDVEH